MQILRPPTVFEPTDSIERYIAEISSNNPGRSEILRRQFSHLFELLYQDFAILSGLRFAELKVSIRSIPSLSATDAIPFFTRIQYFITMTHPASEEPMNYTTDSISISKIMSSEQSFKSYAQDLVITLADYFANPIIGDFHIGPIISWRSIRQGDVFRHSPDSGTIPLPIDILRNSLDLSIQEVFQDAIDQIYYKTVKASHTKIFPYNSITI